MAPCGCKETALKWTQHPIWAASSNYLRRNVSKILIFQKNSQKSKRPSTPCMLRFWRSLVKFELIWPTGGLRIPTPVVVRVIFLPRALLVGFFPLSGAPKIRKWSKSWSDFFVRFPLGVGSVHKNQTRIWVCIQPLVRRIMIIFHFPAPQKTGNDPNRDLIFFYACRLVWGAC